MLNVETFARPESTLPADGIYVPTAEDWAEANAHFDEVDDVRDWEDDAYNPYDDPATWEGEPDDSEMENSDRYGLEVEHFEFDE